MIIGLEWNQADDVTQWLQVASYSYLVNDDGLIKKPAMDGLEVIEDVVLNAELFELHGTDDLGDIIGRVNKDVDMVYREDLESKKIYGYKLVGYRDLVLISTLNSLVKSTEGRYYTYRDSEFVEVTPLTEEDFTSQAIDFSSFNTNTNKRVLAMDSGSIEGTGKSYSKKINPIDFKRMINGLSVK